MPVLSALLIATVMFCEIDAKHSIIGKPSQHLAEIGPVPISKYVGIAYRTPNRESTSHALFNEGDIRIENELVNDGAKQSVLTGADYRASLRLLRGKGKGESYRKRHGQNFRPEILCNVVGGSISGINHRGLCLEADTSSRFLVHRSANYDRQIRAHLHLRISSLAIHNIAGVRDILSHSSGDAFHRVATASRFGYRRFHMLGVVNRALPQSPGGPPQSAGETNKRESFEDKPKVVMALNRVNGARESAPNYAGKIIAGVLFFAGCVGLLIFIVATERGIRRLNPKQQRNKKPRDGENG